MTKRSKDDSVAHIWRWKLVSAGHQQVLGTGYCRMLAQAMRVLCMMIRMRMKANMLSRLEERASERKQWIVSMGDTETLMLAQCPKPLVPLDFFSIQIR